MSERPKMRIAVVGAGVAGLCTMKHFLADADAYEVVTFEQSDDLGGVWKYPDGCEEHRDVPATSSYYSRSYRTLRINAPKPMVELRDFPFADDVPAFFGRATMLAYLRSYADHFSLLPHIKFQHEILIIRPLNDENDENAERKRTRWALQVGNLQTGETENDEFDAVVICNGRYHQPNMPHDFPGLGNFRGTVAHSSQYRTSEEYRGKRVLIVGGRASSTDIACDLSCEVAKVIVSRHKTERVLAPYFNNILETSTVRTLTENGVLLADGTHEEIDAVIFCTGYDYTCSFLHPDCLLEVSRGRVFPLYRHMINCHYTTMALMGICTLTVINPIVDFQAMYFKAVLDGSVVLPSTADMIEDTLADFHERTSAGLPEHHAHKMDTRLWPYLDKLASDLGIASYEPVIRKMFETLNPSMFVKPCPKTKYRFAKLDAENYEYEVLQP